MVVATKLRHPKESLYRTICMTVGGLIWLSVLWGIGLSVLAFIIPIAFFLWIGEKFFQASIYGNAVFVNEEQFVDLNAIVKDVATQLDIDDCPKTFIVNADGMTNALAIKFLSSKYVLLFGSLVDLLWEDQPRQDKLRMIIAHELAHHAAGHTHFWINLLIKPSLFVPFLGSAYSRACELTADRIAADCVKNKIASVESLIALASGGRELLSQTNKDAFIRQEQYVPGFFGFLQEVLSTHPRMTKRVIAIEDFYAMNGSFPEHTVGAEELVSL